LASGSPSDACGDPGYTLTDVLTTEVIALHNIPEQEGLWPLVAECVNFGVRIGEATAPKLPAETLALVGEHLSDLRKTLEANAEPH
jgi:hypothetical protein